MVVKPDPIRILRLSVSPESDPSALLSATMLWFDKKVWPPLQYSTFISSWIAPLQSSVTPSLDPSTRRFRGRLVDRQDVAASGLTRLDRQLGLLSVLDAIAPP